MKRVELVLWFRCNCRCRFCVADERTARQSMTPAEAVRHLRDSRAQGASAVDFGGGEPTLRPDLPALARLARRLGYEDIGVKTNGLRLCYPEYVSALLEAGVRRFTVPIWGSTPEEHDALSRKEGSFELLEMGLKHVADLGGEAEADILLTTETVPRLAGIVERFAGLGVRRFQFWLFCLFGSNGRVPELLPRLTDAGAAVSAAVRALRGRGCAGKRLAFSTTHIPPCFLRPCEGVYLDIARLGLVIVTPGGSFPAESSPFEAGAKTAPCAACRMDSRCRGARPEYLERFGDGELKPFAGRAKPARRTRR